MFEVGLTVANEMMAYEGAMNELRCLAIYLTEHPGADHEDIFELIKRHSVAFAADIYSEGRVAKETVASLTEETALMKEMLGLTADDVVAASRRQLCARGGFWEMRRFLGQMNGAVDEISELRPDHIVCASLSGSVLGEYIGIALQDKHEMVVPVDHIIFKRENKQPQSGILPRNFRLTGPRVLIVEDTVMESRTIRAALAALQIYGEVQPSLFALEVDWSDAAQDSLGLFSNVFTFEE